MESDEDYTKAVKLEIEPDIFVKDEPIEEFNIENNINSDSVRDVEQISRERMEPAVKSCSDDSLEVKKMASLIKTEVCDEDCGDSPIAVHVGIIENVTKQELKQNIDEKNMKLADDECKIEDVGENFITKETCDPNISPSSSLSLEEASPETEQITSLFEDTTDIEMRDDDFEASCSQPENKRFQCPLCRYQTNYRFDLNKHSLRHSDTKQFKCSECDYECNHKSSLTTHILSHTNTKLFKCPDCDYECNRKYYLKMHLLNHLNTKLFKCSECDFECNSKFNIKRHELTHTNVKLFKCSECDYQCNLKNSLKTHMLTHSSIKSFKCTECDYQSNNKSTLKRHVLTHTNVKLFKCPQCDYGCNQKGSLNIHLLNHSAIKLFNCSECSYKTNKKGTYKSHLLRQHSVTI